MSTLYDDHLSSEDLEAIALAEGDFDPWADYTEPVTDNLLDTEEFIARHERFEEKQAEIPPMSETLTNDQKAVVCNLRGQIVVVAGPGAGKTMTLVERTINAVREGSDPSRFLIVTFTRKAANEVRERLAATLGETMSRQFNVTTFHGFAGRVLREDGFRINLKPTYEVLSSSEQKTIVRNLRKQYNLSTDPDYLQLFANVKRNVELKSESARRQELISQGEPHAAELLPAYEAEKRRLERLDYDDMILLAYELLQIPEVQQRWAARFQHVQVDEYQDTDQMQHEIIRAVTTAAQSVMVVGDTDQSLYGWRGSDPMIFATFSKDFPEAQIMYLNDNFRSTPQILDAARHTIEVNEVPYRTELRPNNPIGATPHVELAMDQKSEAQVVTNWIKDLLGKQVPFSEIAVLYRGRRQNLQLQSALSRARIPVKVSGGAGFYERKTVKDLLAWFRLAVKPDEMSFLRVIDQVPGLGPKAAKDLLEAAEAEADGNITSYLEHHVQDLISIGKGKQRRVQAMQDIVEKIDGLREVLDNAGISDALSYALNCIPAETLQKDEITSADQSDILTVLQEDAAAFIPDEPLPLDGANLVYHYLHGDGVMTDPDETTGEVTVLYSSLGENHPGITYPAAVDEDDPQLPVAAQVLTLDSENPLPPPLEFLQQVSLDNQALAEEAGGAIELSTIHAAKGREWDHVAVIGLVDGLFPGGRGDDGQLVTPTEEERRIMFVAITRARKTLLMTSFRTQRLNDGGIWTRRPSIFLYELEASGTCSFNRKLPPKPRNRRPAWGGRMGVW